MAHILVAGRLHKAGIELLKATAGHTFTLVDDTTYESYAPLVKDADAVLIRTQRMDATIVASSPRLRMVSRHGVGYDAIDVSALNARSIPLAIVGDVNSRAVAEHTLMLMLSAARLTAAHDRASRDGNWNIRNRFETIELDGKTLLLLGFGRIGKRVAALAQAFGMQVSAFDPYVPQEVFDKAGVSREPSIVEALPRADFLSLHVPLSPDGYVIGAAELALMKPTAILVNAARGGLVDEVALDRALKEERLFAAGLDVLESEPPLSGHTLLANPRVTISPHSAGLTSECAARMAVASVQNIVDYFDGRLNPALVVNAREIGFKSAADA